MNLEIKFMSNILVFYFFTKNMSNNMNIVKNLKKMLQMHTKKSLRPKEELHVNQVAATAGKSLEIPKERYILPEKHQVRLT